MEKDIELFIKQLNSTDAKNAIDLFKKTKEKKSNLRAKEVKLIIVAITINLKVEKLKDLYKNSLLLEERLMSIERRLDYIMTTIDERDSLVNDIFETHKEIYNEVMDDNELFLSEIASLISKGGYVEKPNGDIIINFFEKYYEDEPIPWCILLEDISLVIYADNLEYWKNGKVEYFKIIDRRELRPQFLGQSFNKTLGILAKSDTKKWSIIIGYEGEHYLMAQFRDVARAKKIEDVKVLFTLNSLKDKSATFD